MNRNWWWICVVTLLGALAPSASAAGQDGSSLQRLRAVVKPGDLVVVGDTSGREVLGRIAQLTGDNLRVRPVNAGDGLLVGADRFVAYSDVTRIWAADASGEKGEELYPMAASFDGALRGKKIGHRIAVTGVDGRTTTGVISSVTPKDFGLSVDGGATTARTFAERNVQRIAYREQDRIWNGTAWGAVLGLAGSFLMVQGMSGNPNASDAVAPLTLLSLGLGAGIGALVDSALTRPGPTVYERGAAPSAGSQSSRGKTAGVSFALRW